MNLPGAGRVRQIVRRVAPGAVILLYHRVAALPADPQLLCVSPKHFSEHLQVLQRQYHPLRLSELQKRRRWNAWRPGSVVITFDDGYADNFHQAQPLLEAQGIPATVFVTSRGVDSPREFWWDALERVFLLAPTLPAQLRITILDCEYAWDLADHASPPPAAWNVLDSSPAAPRQQAYLDWMNILRGLDVETSEAALSRLFEWAGLQIEAGRPEYLSVTADELRSLPRGTIEIGAHTAHHPSLSVLSLDAQQTEIMQGKSALEEILGHPVESFAYPFGERRDYTPHTVNLARAAGFTCACSNFKGLVTAMSDPYQLPRFIVRDWDGDTFARHLEEWFHG